MKTTFTFCKILLKKVLTTALAVVCFYTSIYAQGFHISGNHLLDANGNEFLIKGMAIPTAWFVSDVNNNISNIKNVSGANTMRIVCTTGMNENDWKTTVTNCINNKVIPMVELHDVTCIDDWTRLNNMAQYWAARASYFTGSGISKYILINLANEWGTGTSDNSNWRDAYKTAISTIRNAGINTTLVIDAAGCGQDYNNSTNMRTYWNDLQNYDPQHNLIFSVHMYGVWSTTSGYGNSDPATGITAMRNSGMPFIVGEFAGGGSYGSFNPQSVLNSCNSNFAGYLAWSWKGNSEPALDMANTWNGSSLSGYGNTVINGSFGIKTANTCSVFNTSTSGAISDGTYEITFRHDGLSLNVEGNSTADGGNVIQYSYGGGRNEQWFVKNLGNSQYSIINANSGRGLDVVNASTADGADINQWYYAGNANQKWRIESVGSGYYRIVNVNSSKCVDMPGSSTASGTSIDQWSCNGGNNQSFTFTKLSSATAGSIPGILFAAPGTITLSALNIYPNPSTGAFRINNPEPFSYAIFSANGVLLEKGKGQSSILVGIRLASGIYIVDIRDSKGSTKIKLVKI